MQQTKLDRHLREKYSFVTSVFSNTKPQNIPRGIRVEELDRERGAPYRYRYSSRKYVYIEQLARSLESENITYTSRVTDRNVWYGKWINNPKKSFTYRMVFIGLLVATICFAFSPLPGMLVAYINAEEEVEKPKEPKASVFARIKKTGEKLNSFAGLSQKWEAFFVEDDKVDPTTREKKQQLP